jgi:hydrogenase maturation protease
VRQPLVIAIGNPLRSDDGAGPALAELLRREGLRVLVVHQLGPELCDEVAAAPAVVFVDARAGDPAGSVRVTPLTGGAGSGATTHAVAPEVVLALAERLHGAHPAASFELGEGLTPEVARALPTARRAVEQLLAELTGAAP